MCSQIPRTLSTTQNCRETRSLSFPRYCREYRRSLQTREKCLLALLPTKKAATGHCGIPVTREPGEEPSNCRFSKCPECMRDVSRHKQRGHLQGWARPGPCFWDQVCDVAQSPAKSVPVVSHILIILTPQMGKPGPATCPWRKGRVQHGLHVPATEPGRASSSHCLQSS